jgi:hypothetical protein
VWFDSVGDLTRVAAVGTAAYVTLVVALRLSGKRTLAKLNAFDLVVTVALGSALATVVLDPGVSWAEGRRRSPCSSCSSWPCRGRRRGCGLGVPW